MTRNLFLAALACGLCFTAVAQDLKLLREREEQLVAVSILFHLGISTGPLIE